MNNFKKIGMTALAASLVSTSVFAGELTVAGSAGLNWENYSGASGAAAGTSQHSTKSFSMGNQITFTGGGELDNGLTVGLTFVIDDAEQVFDGHNLSLSSDGFGTLVFSGEGADSAENAVGDTAAGNIWDTYDGRQGANSKLKESNATDDMFNYTLPSMVDDLTVAVSYVPAAATGSSDTAFSLTYAGVDGLTMSYGQGSSDQTGGTASDADSTSMKLSYVYGSVTVAYSDSEFDSNTATADQDTTSYKLSYAVSDDFSVTYGQEEMSSGTTTDQDAEYTKLSASYTSGGMTVSANMSEMENGTYTTAVAGDEEYIGLGVSFAF